jgi:two-component system chemotaxis response regulator CheB
MIPAQGKKIRVLVVDDSSFMRMAIRNILAADPAIEVVGTAADGVEGVEKAISLSPDIITMDVEMPRMDGIAALKQVMAKAPTRVIMVSTLTNEGARATFDALDAGAIDYIPKNITDSADAQRVFREELLKKVKSSVGSAFSSAAVPQLRRVITPPRPVAAKSRLASKHFSVVGIGASTGGPVALQEVLSRIPMNFPHPIVAAIHMPKAFTGPYAERLNAKCSIEIREAVNGDILKPGKILIAPGGVHTTVVKQGTTSVIKLVPTSEYPGYVYVPSVDILISSMAEVSNGSMLGVILTGMGSDGFKGMKLLKSKGGATIVQDEATSTIYGMPRACVEGGVADEVLPLDQIGFEIARVVN